MKKLFLFAVAIFAMTLVACSGGSTKTPEGVVKKYAEAIANMDVKAAAELMNISEAEKANYIKEGEASMEEIKAYPELLPKMEVSKISEGKVIEKDKKIEFDVTMKITITLGGKEQVKEESQKITAVKVGDEWKVEE